MGEIIKSSTDVDLCETAVLEGCNALGVTPTGEILVAGMANWHSAHEVGHKLGMVVCIVPEKMLCSTDAWAINTKTRGIFWSTGAC